MLHCHTKWAVFFLSYAGENILENADTNTDFNGAQVNELYHYVDDM